MSVRDELIALLTEAGVDDLHSFRCMYPKRHGECTCKDDLCNSIFTRFPWMAEEHEVEWRDVWNDNNDFDEESRYVTPWKGAA